MLTPNEVAKKLGLHVATIRRMIHDGRLSAVRMGTGTHARLRIDEKELELFIDKNTLTGVAWAINQLMFTIAFGLRLVLRC